MKTRILTSVIIMSFLTAICTSTAFTQTPEPLYTSAQYAFFDESDIAISSLFSQGRTYLKVKIQHVTENAHFTIERSVDGQKYFSVGSVNLSASQASYEMLYSFVDDESFNGSSYYRVTNFNRRTRALMSVVLNLKLVTDDSDFLTALE